MKNLAPDIVRQRLLIEGQYTVAVDAGEVRDYLLGLAAHLELRAYGDPVVYSPGSGMGSGENEGFDAFVPLIDSGISAYVWSRARFFSVVLYTCKHFEARAAVEYTRERLGVTGELEWMSF